MEVSQEKVDDLNAIINITLDSADYKNQVEQVLKDYRKRANMPGFRPGMVPMGMVKKMYGKSAIAEEVNKILQEKLNAHISENQLEVLGNPLPRETDEVEFDAVKYPTMYFTYDVGLAPAFEVKLTGKEKFDYYTIDVDKDLIGKYTNDLARRYGSVSEADTAADNDMLNGEFVELDNEGNPAENGIKSTSTISIEFVEDEQVKKSLVGTKKGDVLTLDPETVSKGHEDMGKMLQVDHDKVHQLIHDKVKFQFTVNQVYAIQPAEMNQELYDKLFGEGVVDSQEAFEAKIKSQLEGMFVKDSDQLLLRHIQDSLLDKHKLELPDPFLKRWLKAANEQPLTDEQIEEEYEQYAKSLRWQLIESKLVKAHEIEVSGDDMREHTKQLMMQQFAQYGQADIDESIVDDSVNRVLQNQEEARKIYEQLQNQKLLGMFKDTLKLKTKAVNFDEFVKLATGESPKKGILSNLTNIFG